MKKTLSLHIKLLPFLFLTLATPALQASDLEREIRMKDQIIDYIMDGEAILLNDEIKKHEFLTIYMETDEEKPKGAVIIMHGRGYHPDWPELVNPLRTGLPENGWNTLSIQMPVLDNNSTFYDYLYIIEEGYPRIDAAIEFLKKEGINNIVLLAHSCSVHMAMDWLHKHPDSGASAFIGVGMGSTDKGQPMLKPFPLAEIKIPVLDIRGENDYPAVKRDAPNRWENIQKAGNPKSDQRVVPDSDHYFTDRGEALLEEVNSWLDTL